jgi:hypothetical protein
MPPADDQLSMIREPEQPRRGADHNRDGRAAAEADEAEFHDKLQKSE